MTRAPQLGQILQRDLPEVPIQLTVVDGRGFCLRFSPLTEPCRPLDADVLDDWADCLAQQTVSGGTRGQDTGGLGRLSGPADGQWGTRGQDTGGTGPTV